MNPLRGNTPEGTISPPKIRPATNSFCVFNKTQNSLLALGVDRCDTTLTRLRGLLGKLELKSGEGMWFVPSQGVHTIGMLFPIDVIFLDEHDRVIYVIEHMRPFRISPIRLKSVSVLELAAHTIYSSQTQIGDELLICPPDEVKACVKASQSAAQHPVEANGKVV